VLDVILDNSIRQVGFSKKSAGTRGFKLDVGDLAPTNGCQAVKTELPSPNLQVGGQRQDMMSTALSS
jgi:hypothetical protein